MRLRYHGVELGRHACIYDKIYFKKARTARIVIGSDLTFSSGCGYNPLCRNLRGSVCVDGGATLKIGNHVGMSSPCLWVKSSLTIGNNVKIGGDCILIDNDAHSLDYKIRNSGVRLPDGTSLDVKNAARKPIVIGDDVLIGTRCIILKGVTIGPRSVIGAGSVVTKDIPADCIAAGNPARVIKTNINQPQ